MVDMHAIQWNMDANVHCQLKVAPGGNLQKLYIEGIAGSQVSIGSSGDKIEQLASALA